MIHGYTKIVNFTKKIKILLILTLIIFSILTLLLFGGYRYWSSPEFCKSCHIMVPYYNAWKTSSHKNVACVKCHFEPGIENELKGKWNAIKQLASFLTGAYSSKPYAEITDRSCLRSGCHNERLISGKVLYTKRNIHFDHTPHLTEIRGGIKLSCTSCHSQIVIGTHISVTNDTCFLCHFKSKEDKEQQNCLLCHTAPEKPIIKGEFVIDHNNFVKRGINCRSCHIDVIVGKGEVSKDKCFHCHNDIDKVEKFNNTELLHINHITIRKVECSRCHETIEHKFNTALIHKQNEECGACHKNFHIWQQKFYMGEGAIGLEGKPDPMFQVGIGCSACHVAPKINKNIGEKVNETLISNKYTCFACHGKKYKDFPSNFINKMEKYILSFEKFINAIDTHTLLTSSSDNKLITSLKFNVNFLKMVKPIHNPFYAIDILQKCLNDIESIIKVVKIKEDELNDFTKIKKEFKENVCNLCHSTIVPPSIVKLNNKEFPHKKHLEELEIPCKECHKIDEEKLFSIQHPPSSVTTDTCKSCHE